MFSLTVRDRMMVAHSLHGDFFGPAQRVHGATYVVEATVRADDLESHDVVVDIGALSRELRSILSELDYRLLDEEAAFAGVNTTTEVLARTVVDRLVDRASAGALGDEITHLREVEVVLRESDIAWAACSRGLSS